jgi:hypothetical protein
LVQKIKALQTAEGKELFGLQLMASFDRLRIQPLQVRASHMWNYSGSSDETRVSKEDFTEEEVKKMVC